MKFYSKPRSRNFAPPISMITVVSGQESGVTSQQVVDWCQQQRREANIR